MRALLIRVRGWIAFCGYVVNTLFWVMPIFVISLFKLIPVTPLRTGCSYLLDHCASAWISVNTLIEKLFHPVDIRFSGDTHFSTQEWYMVIANHQSWVDILILQRLLNHKIPFLKFFLKQQLLYVPVLGLAWWALDFPFMRRYSTAQLKKNPKLKGKDIEITRKACAKFKHKPVSVMNFVEGTRFSPAKHSKQGSPYRHLLKPKAGGMAFALSAMGEQIHKLVDVTIYYPGKVPSFWEYICGDLSRVYVDVKITDIAQEMRGDYMNDRQFKIGFQEQLNLLWQRKDALLSQYAEQADKQAEDSAKHV
ncbi:acyltransferase [Shewanella salipaludis]|uniref:Acyltransferase n=1 Tax=Shewanella salipaludis TaxID=2723052 RepID=A0A972G090_9GAMM|nr:acyltransferase [Shewanella salipaludis]NMH65131.1 acyltransferase [Shewanella salipaludis]